MDRSCKKHGAAQLAKLTTGRLSIASAFLLAGVYQLPAQAVTAQVTGQGALVCDYQANLPPFTEVNQACRLPLGLTLEGKASDTVSLFLGLNAGLNNFPYPARPVGNTGATTADNTSDGPSLPFTRNGGRGEKVEPVSLNLAYIQYASPVGLFRAGRMPRHWGLGVWHNAEWTPEGGSLSTSDAISATVDFSPTFSATLYWEKLHEGNIYNISEDADGISGELLLADNPADPSSTGIVRQIGIAFSNFRHAPTSTELRIVDIFSQVYYGPFLGGFEVVFPTGRTRSPQYATLGGAGPCSAEQPDVTCDEMRVEGLSALGKMRFLLSGGSSPESGQSLVGLDEARRSAPTALRGQSQTVGLTLGYSRGDSDAFSPGTGGDNVVNAVPMHPNIQPSLLMFSPTAPLIEGMPGRQVKNAIFARADYTYESPTLGMITPALIWGRLDTTNRNPVESRADGLATVGTQGTNLGVELNLGYAYKTAGNMNLGADLGAWMPGNGWARESGQDLGFVYGFRAKASTSF